MASLVSEFLRRKMEERNLSLEGLASSMGISIDLTRKYLSESGRYLPSDRVAKKLAMALKLTREEESELLRHLEQDREKALPSDELLADDFVKGAPWKGAVGALWAALVLNLILTLAALGIGIMLLLRQ
ncbi:MAG: helix-turn-helix transcriptional regulator [Candidatus Eremiobacteraeota bacterium]|nr:helix-turn-helix transcriptional regulator [Candidatus Eremiobacteraeota bacterium]